MKRFLAFALLLTPVLPASADLKLTGEAAMGLNFNGTSTRATTGTRLTATWSQVTDGGLEFGAVIRMDHRSGRPGGPGGTGETRLAPAQLYFSYGNPEPPGHNRKRR